MTKMPMDKRYVIDNLAAQTGGFFVPPAKEDMAYTKLLFDVCEQFGIRYYSAAKKERHIVEDVARVTWVKPQEEKTRVRQDIRPAFSA